MNGLLTVKSREWEVAVGGDTTICCGAVLGMGCTLGPLKDCSGSSIVYSSSWCSIRGVRELKVRRGVVSTTLGPL